MPSPNFLLVICDHLSPRVMGCYGDDDSATPAMDAVARAGTRFSNAHCTTPLCQPSRASFWSGLPPHRTGVWSNGIEGQHPHHDPPMDPATATLGSLFRAAGHRTVHFGKQHDAGALRGFDCAPPSEEPVEAVDGFPINGDTRTDAAATRACIDFLETHPQGEPFFAVADLNNPHNICGWVGEHAGETEAAGAPGPEDDLPALPPNFEVDDLDARPDPVKYLCCAHPRLAQASQWGPGLYRRYLQAYRHYTRIVDDCFERIHAALARRGDAENTVVVLMSDHGDGLASHRMVTKHTSFYEQFMRVPLVFSGPGIRPGESTALASLLDLLPTCCELAGIDVPADKPGRSLAPWLRGQPPTAWRDHLVGEWWTEWGYTANPGRMIRENRFKYIAYRNGEGPELQEELYDLQSDPWETRTIHREPQRAGELDRLRKKLRRHLADAADPFFEHRVHVPEGFRTHPVGFGHHRGPAAPAASPR